MSAAVGRLSTEERDALILSALSPDDDCAHNMVPLYAAVEQIVARHLAAFKAEAVAAIEAECPTNARDGFMCPPCRQSVRLVEALDP